MKQFEVIKQVQETSGRLDKEAILNANKGDETLLSILYNVFNPLIVFGIKDKKLNKFLNEAAGEKNEFDDLLSVFEYLKVNKTGNDATVSKVAEFIKAQEEQWQEYYAQCVTKSLKIGGTAKTLNKVFGKGFCPEFSVMLAKKFEDEQHKVTGEFVITEKLDGYRVVAVKEEGQAKFFSRQGQSIQELVELEPEILQLPNGVYDGELVIKDDEGLKDREVLQQTLKLAKRDGEKRGVVLHLFDAVSVEEFKEGKSQSKFIERKDRLFDLIDGQFEFVRVVHHLYVGFDKEVIPPMLEEMDSKGKEGLMLNSDDIWENKRSDKLLKLKTMLTADLKVTGFVEGTGKYKGMLGKLVVDYKGFDLGVGSGFSDEQREEIWNNQDRYLGRVVEVQYFRESKSQTGNVSVSFPVFKMFREEGKEVSYY
ncbi:ATP-dependent DNA ligase [Alkalihalobacillus sp. NPDC078783]